MLTNRELVRRFNHWARGPRTKKAECRSSCGGRYKAIFIKGRPFIRCTSCKRPWPFEGAIIRVREMFPNAFRRAA